MAENEQTISGVQAADPDRIQAEVARIRSAHPDAIVGIEEQPERGLYWIRVKPRTIVPVAKLLRDDRNLDYKLLADLFCIDRPESEKRFNVVYNLYSVTRNRRTDQIFVKLVNPTPAQASVTIDLKGVAALAPTATAITLAADPNATNSIDEPRKVVPTTSKVSGIRPSFPYAVPAHGIVVLKLDSR